MIENSQLSQEQVLLHFLQCDPEFLNELKKRVDLEAYSLKLSSRAELMHLTEQGRVLALLAYYVDEVKLEAFVSNVSVIREFQGRGFAKSLLGALQNKLSSEFQACLAIRLEVSKANERAIGLYRTMGFKFSSPKLGNLRCEMRKAL